MKTGDLIFFLYNFSSQQLCVWCLRASKTQRWSCKGSLNFFSLQLFNSAIMRLVSTCKQDATVEL